MTHCHVESNLWRESSSCSLCILYSFFSATELYAPILQCCLLLLTSSIMALELLSCNPADTRQLWSGAGRQPSHISLNNGDLCLATLDCKPVYHTTFFSPNHPRCHYNSTPRQSHNITPKFCNPAPRYSNHAPWSHILKPST